MRSSLGAAAPADDAEALLSEDELLLPQAATPAARMAHASTTSAARTYVERRFAAPLRSDFDHVSVSLSDLPAACHGRRAIPDKSNRLDCTDCLGQYA